MPGGFARGPKTTDGMFGRFSSWGSSCSRPTTFERSECVRQSQRNFPVRSRRSTSSPLPLHRWSPPDMGSAASRGEAARNPCCPPFAGSTIPPIWQGCLPSHFHAASRGRGFQSVSSSWRGRLMKPPCSASLTPTSKRQRGTHGHPRFLGQRARIASLAAERARKNHLRSRTCGSAPRNLRRFPNNANNVKMVPAISMKTTATAAMVGVKP
jgi:hypothetical protein